MTITIQCVFIDVCFVLFISCLYICVCVCLQTQGPLRECRSMIVGALVTWAIYTQRQVLLCAGTFVMIVGALVTLDHNRSCP